LLLAKNSEALHNFEETEGAVIDDLAPPWGQVR